MIYFTYAKKKKNSSALPGLSVVTSRTTVIPCQRLRVGRAISVPRWPRGPTASWLV